MRTTVDEVAGETTPQTAETQQPVKRGRGRPRKTTIAVDTVAAPTATPVIKRRKRFTLPEMEYIQKGDTKTVKFPLAEDFICEPNCNRNRKYASEHGKIYHLLPRIWDYPNREISDAVNPRSHEASSLRHPIAKDIEATLRTKPEEFHNINRGITILADSLHYNNGQVEIVLSSPTMHGVVDGATTDLILFKLKHDLKQAMELEAGTEDYIANGRVSVRVVVGISSHEQIERISEGLNTSRAVRSWSLSAFRGEFNTFRDILDAPSSPFAGKIGWDEAADNDVSALDVLSYITLFHPEFEENSDASPAIAYSSKGRLHERLADEKLAEGYKLLQPLYFDILKLHDHIYSTFSMQYDRARKGEAKLGRRIGFERRPTDDPIKLPLTGSVSNYRIDNGIIYPLLNSLRPLVRLGRKGNAASWKKNPFNFYDTYAPKLINHLIELLENEGNSPNKLAKNKLAYSSLARETLFLLNKERTPNDE